MYNFKVGYLENVLSHLWIILSIFFFLSFSLQQLVSVWFMLGINMNPTDVI